MFWKHDTHGWLRYSTVGLEFSLIFVGMLLLGLWVDTKDKVTPAWTLVMGAAGFGMALYRLVREAQQIRRQDEQDKAEAPQSKPPGSTRHGHDDTSDSDKAP